MTTLSIVIREYNFVCTALVRSLLEQCEKETRLSGFEILLVDDGSTDARAVTENTVVTSWPHCRLIRHTGNAGRAVTLNTGIKEARGQVVILCDCDAEVASSAYISRYIDVFEHPENKIAVVCGGLKTSPKYLTKDNHLRYRYETQAARRGRSQYHDAYLYERFSTFNAAVRSDVFRTITFNEGFRQYGYEDTLFGISLQRHGIPMTYIDNPLIHTGMDSNAEYLQKTETALRNLHRFSALLAGHTALSRLSERLRRHHLAPLVRLWHRMFSGLERRNLLGRHPNLMLFQLYKTGYFMSLPPTGEHGRNGTPNG